MKRSITYSGAVLTVLLLGTIEGSNSSNAGAASRI